MTKKGQGRAGNSRLNQSKKIKVKRDEGKT